MGMVLSSHVAWQDLSWNDSLTFILLDAVDLSRNWSGQVILLISSPGKALFSHYFFFCLKKGIHER